MKIILNNRQEVFERDQITVTEMLDLKKFTYKMRIIRINGKLIKRDDYDRAIIRDGDDVQMHYLMSGG